MGKVWAIDAIALFSQQNWIPLTVFHAGFGEIIFLKWRNDSNSIGSFSYPVIMSASAKTNFPAMNFVCSR